MNNCIVEYNDITAFHPGYYVAEVIEDMGITQEEFAARLNTTAKTVSQLVNGKCNLSRDLAKKLSVMLGTSPEVWLNLQTAYDQKLIEIELEKELAEQTKILNMIDYRYFEECGFPPAKSPMEKTINLCSIFGISTLRKLQDPDLVANFRTAVSTTEEKQTVNSQAWLLLALRFANEIAVQPYSAEKLKAALPEIRSMTLQSPDVFLPRLRELLAECGVAFVLLPHLKNSGVNGVMKWTSPDRAVLAINDRRAYADTFWFSLFHELKHVLQHKPQTVFLTMSTEAQQTVNQKLEDEADTFAQNYLIPQKEYERFAPSRYTSDEQICTFAASIGIHPGVVAGRMQHDKIIPHSRCASLKQRYKVRIVTQSKED